MPEFMTCLFAWLLAGSLVWLLYQTTGLIARGALQMMAAHRLDSSLALLIAISLVVILNWPAFAFLAGRDVVRAYANGFRRGWRI